jgi:hypothetical protein
VATSTYTALLFDVEDYDPQGWHTGTGGNILPLVEGYYTASAVCALASGGAAVTRAIAVIAKNGSLTGTNILGWVDLDGIGGLPRLTMTAPDFYMNGTTDYIQVQFWQNSGVSKTVSGTASMRLVNPT